MHDCGHNSLFTKRKLNRFFGFLLGLVNGIPQKSWSIDHAFHHRNNGNWEIYKGPIDVLSLEDYKSPNFHCFYDEMHDQLTMTFGEYH